MFNATVELVAKFSPEVVRPERALNVSVLEAIMVGVAKRLGRGEIKEEAGCEEVAMSLVKDEEFLQKCKVGTTDAENVRTRIGISIERFRAVV